MAKTQIRTVPYAAKRHQLRVPVGATPMSRYATWDEHREEMRRTATEAKERVLARHAA